MIEIRTQAAFNKVFSRGVQITTGEKASLHTAILIQQSGIT